MLIHNAHWQGQSTGSNTKDTSRTTPEHITEAQQAKCKVHTHTRDVVGGFKFLDTNLESFVLGYLLGDNPNYTEIHHALHISYL